MRILMFGWEFPPHISGGLGTACSGITKALLELGNEVIFVLPKIKENEQNGPLKLLSAAKVLRSKQGVTDEPWDKMEAKVIQSPLNPYITEDQYAECLTDLAHKGALHQPCTWALSGGYGPNLAAEVRRYGKAAEYIVGREHFDIIHGHDWTSVMACVNAKRISGRPYIYHAHALEFDRSGENINREIYAIEKYGLEMAAQVIAVSFYTRDAIIDRYGIAQEKITVIHNAVARRESTIRIRSRKRGDKKIVLFLGRITFQKGPDYFVEAAALVSQVIPGVRFVMAGAGDMMPRIRQRVAELGLERHFRFPGFLKGRDVDRMYAMSDLYVMPSVSEPFGISPLEAMLYDVPVIISKQSGVSEILHHALKVDFWNVRELASKIIAVLNNPTLVGEMTVRASAELKSIRWEQAAEKIIALYKNTLVSS